MQKVIVDYKKLTPEILELFDDDIIVFDNHRNETIEAVEVISSDTHYLVKINSRLHYTMTNFSNDELKVNELGNVIFEEEE
jgi:hypothetical protein